MDLELIKERDMPLMSKKRYSFYLNFKGTTPARKDIKEAVAKMVKSEPELTVVKHIYTRYGIEKAKVIANVYSNKEDMEKFEEKSTLEKNKAKEEPKEEAAEAPAAPAEEAKPAEEAPAEASDEKKEEAAAE